MRLPRLEFAQYIKDKIVAVVGTSPSGNAIPVSMLQGTPPPGTFIVYDFDMNVSPAVNNCTKLATVELTINVSGERTSSVLDIQNKVEAIFDKTNNTQGIIDGISEPGKRWFVERLFQRGSSTIGNLFVAGVARPTGVIIATTRIYEYER